MYPSNYFQAAVSFEDARNFICEGMDEDEPDLVCNECNKPTTEEESETSPTGYTICNDCIDDLIGTEEPTKGE